jgi:ferric-dicitrate binding protein FerR (iron transport regulator)
VKPRTEQIAVQYVEKTTKRGEIITVVLPDHTEVTLNAGSRIIYPTHFTGDERSVELYGEALFDVTSDPARPFTVKTEKMNVKVVGTVFDVKDYNEDGLSSVSVASGKVEVALAGEKLLLEQNQQVTMYKATGNFEKMTIDAGNYLSWTEGTLYFYRTPIREVINILNRLYPQVDIELAEGEYSNLITGKHDNITSDNIIKGIAYAAGLKCKKAGNKYTLYNE